MQLCKNYVNLKHCIGQKFNVIAIKTAHRGSYLLKTLISQDLFASMGLRKNLSENSQKFQSENWHFYKKYCQCSHEMRMDEKYHKLFMYSYNKNVLKCAQIA